MFSRQILKPALTLLLGVVLSNNVFAQSSPRYTVEIRRTSHGIPHITAKDVGSLGR